MSTSGGAYSPPGRHATRVGGECRRLIGRQRLACNFPPNLKRIKLTAPTKLSRIARLTTWVDCEGLPMLLTSVLTRSRPRARTVVAVSPSRARHLLVCMGAQGHYEVERKFAFRTSDVGAQPFKHRTGPRLRSARLSRGMRGGWQVERIRADTGFVGWCVRSGHTRGTDTDDWVSV